MMNHVIEMLFNYREHNYSCIASISAVPEGYDIHIEMLDETLIALFDGSDIRYHGDKGYRHLPAYKDKHVRPLLIHMASCIQSVRRVLYNPLKE